MAIQDIKKVHIFGLKKHEEQVMEFLQKFGATQITRVDPEAEPAETDFGSNEFERVDFCLSFLKPIAPKKGMLEALQEEIKEKDFDWVKNLVENYDLSAIHSSLKQIDSQLRDLEREEREMNSEIEVLSRYSNCRINISQLTNLRKTRFVLGSIEHKHYPDLEGAIGDLCACFKVIDRDSKHQFIAFLYHRDEEKKLYEVFTEFGVTLERLPVSEGTIPERIEHNKQKLTQINEKKAALLHEAGTYCGEIDNLEIIYDYYYSLKIRSAEKANLVTTRYAFILKAFVPANVIEALRKGLESTADSIEITVEDFADDEEAPLLLSNPGFLKPCETVTTLYGLPNRKEYDPTPILSAFFILFFGICLTDAAYGIILAALAFFLIKYLKFRGGMKRLFTLLIYTGIVTIFAGALAGGWLGITVETLQKHAPYLLVFQIIDPAKEALRFMIIALVIGVIQLVFGLLVKASLDWKRGDMAAFVFDDLTWAVYLSSITCFMFTQGAVFKYLIYITAATIILTGGRTWGKGLNPVLSVISKFFGGIISLYNTMGYLGDVLSYSRLMALGLATGGIAMVINLLAGMMYEAMPVAALGFVVAGIFLVVAHLVNVVINALGAFIHSARLQYVEFFPKFFEGGGKPFRPFGFRFRKVIITNSINEEAQ